MKPLTQLLESLVHALTAEQEQEALQLFDALSDAQLAELTSTRYIKSWPAGMVLRHLPVGRLVPYVEPLLVHLQSLNWSAMPYVAEVLVAMGAPVVPALRRVFATDSNDGIWIINLIYNVIQRWEVPLARLLEAELVGYVRYAAREGESIAALEALQRLLPAEEHRPTLRLPARGVRARCHASGRVTGGFRLRMTTVLSLACYWFALIPVPDSLS